MNLSKLWDIRKDREAWSVAVHGSRRIRHDLTTKQKKSFICGIKIQMIPLIEERQTYTYRKYTDGYQMGKGGVYKLVKLG